MFDLLFNGMAAFSQAMTLLGGVICAGIGLLILGNGWYWRLRAQRVDGTIIGVRQKDKVYYNVYRYILPNGETQEATSDSGSGLTGGRETGRAVRLILFPDRPDRVREPGAVLMTMIGLCFLLPGIFLLKTSFTHFPVTPMTGIVLAALLGVAALKIRKNIIPKEQRLSLTDWQAARKRERDAELNALPVRPIEEILDSPEKRLELQRQRKANRVMAPLLLLAGAGIIAGGLYMGRNVQALEDNGLRAPGEVVRLEESRDSDGTSYFAVVSFMDDRQRQITFRDSFGASTPFYRTGEKVTVLYLARNPQNTAKIDRQVWNWLPPGALALLGALLCFLGLKLLPSRDDTV